jgi:hypothetical protein
MSESLNLLESSLLVQNCISIVQLIKRTNNAPKPNFLIISSNKIVETRKGFGIYR